MEDNAINQRVVLQMLEQLGLRADVAANGCEALIATAQLAYDLILMDCHMPELDGFATTTAIRAREGQDQHTVIIALTADALCGERDHCLAVGMDDYPHPVGGSSRPLAVCAPAGRTNRDAGGPPHSYAY